MYSLAQLFQGINECYPLIDKVLNSLQSINKRKVSASVINQTIDNVENVLSQLNKIVKLIDGATETLPKYLSFLQGKQNQLQNSIDRVTLTIGAYNVLNPQTAKESYHVVQWEKGGFDIKTNNTIVTVKTELSSIKFLLKRMEEKLK